MFEFEFIKQSDNYKKTKQHDNYKIRQTFALITLSSTSKAVDHGASEEAFQNYTYYPLLIVN